MYVDKLAVFDLDGTLNQTHLYSVKAGYKAVEAMGYNPSDFTEDMFISCLGKRGEDYTRELMPDLDDEGVKRFLEIQMEFEHHFISLEADCFEGVRESISILRAAGWGIAVCSNAKLEYINMALDALKLQEQIDYKQELLPNLTKKDTLKLLLDRVKPNKAVMIGDRIYDKEAAEFNNIPFVGCAYSYRPEEVKDNVYVNSAFELASVIHSLV